MQNKQLARILSVCCNDTNQLIEGVRRTVDSGRKVVILANTDNHRKTLRRQLQMAKINSQMVAIITIHESRNFFAGYRGRELFIPRLTIIGMLRRVANNPGGSL